MVKVSYRLNLISANIFMYVYFLCITACAPEIPHAYNPEKAQKIYTKQTQTLIQLSDSIDNLKYKTIAYWNIYFQDRLPFMGIDSILDSSTAINIGKYMKSKPFYIGHTSIYSDQIHTKFPLQNISYLYNRKYDTYYAWYPQEWGAYVLKNDSIITEEYDIKLCTIYTIKSAIRRYEDRLVGLPEDYQNKRRTLTWKNDIWNDFYIVETKVNKPYSLYSLRGTYHFNLLSNIVSEMDNIANTDSVINYLQNQCNFSGHSFFDGRCLYLVDSPIIDEKNKQYLYLLVDTCKLTTSPHLFLDIYEKMSIADLFNLTLLYPDFTKEKIPEIAEYAEKTKPTFIYFKRAYRSGYSNEPYYYFIFYYIDFIPFMPPRLRDMQVVFPRRFGLS